MFLAGWNERVARVLDDLEPVAICDVTDSIPVWAVAGQVQHQDCTGLLGDHGLDLGDVDGERVGLDVHEHRAAAGRSWPIDVPRHDEPASIGDACRSNPTCSVGGGVVVAAVESAADQPAICGCDSPTIRGCGCGCGCATRAFIELSTSPDSFRSPARTTYPQSAGSSSARHARFGCCIYPP